MLEKLIEIEKIKGWKNKLSVEERLMMTLEYWKKYYTFFQMSIKYKISPSSCFRNISWIENKLSNNKDYQFFKKKYKSKNDKKQENSNEFQFYLIDSTEIEIEKSTKKLQLEYFSGKSWMYSIKFQIVYDLFNKNIVDIFADNGKVYDFQILKNSNLEFSENTIIIGDLGYQGMQNIYKNTIIPIKKSKNKKLTKQEKNIIRLYLKLELKLNMFLLDWKDSKF